MEYRSFYPFVGIGSPPPTTPQASVAPPRTQVGDTLACGGGRGEPSSDDGTETLVLYVYYNPSTGGERTQSEEVTIGPPELIQHFRL
jgi:hypothetical protein